VPVDAGTCSLDPGGTPCSQCIVNDCCQQTENCISDSSCAGSLPCYQSCVVGGGVSAACEQMCCSDSTCNTWVACVAADCAASCP
jgi:hypothetical protein